MATLVMQTWSQVSAGLSTSFGMGGKVLEEMKKRKGWQVAPEVKAAALMQLSTQCRSVDLYGLPHAARLSQTPYANQQGVEPIQECNLIGASPSKQCTHVAKHCLKRRTTGGRLS